MIVKLFFEIESVNYMFNLLLNCGFKIGIGIILCILGYLNYLNFYKLLILLL